MAIDQKYGKLDVPGVPDDEPVFVLRAQDKFGVELLRRYQEICIDGGSPTKHVMLTNDCIDAFQAWPKKKVPD